MWKVHRKALNKAFNPKSLQSFLPIFREKVKYLVRNIGEKVDDDYFDISPFIHACTLDMVCGKWTNGSEAQVLLEPSLLLIELPLVPKTQKLDHSEFLSQKLIWFMLNCNLVIAVATTMGAEIEAQNGKNADFVEALGKWVMTLY